MMKKPTILLLSLFGLIAASSTVSAHCQIPCGIFGDDLVFGKLYENVETIEKSMREIERLSADLSENPHQLVRWVVNKEDHAQKIQDEMSAYFLAQRIKLDLRDTDPEAYRKMVDLAHEITVLAMRCKHGTDLGVADKLHHQIHAFQEAYEAVYKK